MPPTPKETWEILAAVLDVTDPTKPKLRVDAVLEASDITIGDVVLKGAAIKSAASKATASGDTTLIAAVTGKKICITRIFLNNAGSTNRAVAIKITQGGVPVNLYPATLVPGAIVSPKDAPDHFECDTATAVKITLDDTGAINYQINYTLA